jgi:acetolactate synthase-1/2/3 large subunit
MAKTVQVASVAEAYLELLAARGVDYFFGNGGTDFAPIVEAYANRFAHEEMLPKPIAVPHEITAMAMAHGYTMVTGKPQVVMVHTLPGTANATGGVINAFRSNTPMLFTAGRTPLTEGDLTGSRDGGIHWGQESFDQGSMVREWVKWDYELRPDADLEGVVDRALAISQSEPAGPVSLTLPREVLAKPLEEFTYSDTPRMAPAEPTMPPPDQILKAAKALASAKNPMLITQDSGRDPGAVQPLVDLAELLGMPVFESRVCHLNFPQNHPLYAGSNVAGTLPDADVVIVLEIDVPWTPKRTGPNESATVISIGVDPLFSKYPVRGYRSDQTLAGSPKPTLIALVEAIKKIGVNTNAAKERTDTWAAARKKRQTAIAARAEAGKDQTPINKAYFSRELSKHLGDDTILLSELGLDTSQMEFTTPGTTYAGSPAGILGWAIGAALGAKLAAPEKTVICTLGDGSYTFGVPSAGHIVSKVQNLPVLFIVWNNGIWNAVKSSAKNMVPDGVAVATDTWAFTDLDQECNYEMYCQASGGYGERVDDPAEVPAAIERALHAVQVEGRQALLNVIGA